MQKKKCERVGMSRTEPSPSDDDLARVRKQKSIKVACCAFEFVYKMMIFNGWPSLLHTLVFPRHTLEQISSGGSNRRRKKCSITDRSEWKSANSNNMHAIHIHGCAGHIVAIKKHTYTVRRHIYIGSCISSKAFCVSAFC